VTIVLTAPPTASGAALRLRPWRSDDLSALLTAHRDPLLRRWLSTSLTDEAEAGHWLTAQAAGWAAATRFSFAVVAGADDRPPVGHVAVNVGTTGTAEVGYWTAPEARRQGVAARALATVSRWALDEQRIVGLTRLDLFHTERNEASCRVASRCGFPLRDLLPATPDFPAAGHRHVRAATAEPG
jgi:RimJ/RimL family protein N-acetyltransferase